MINLMYNKGQTCKVKPVLCQEGFCSECAIYQSKFSRLEMATSGLLRSRSTESQPLRSGMAVTRELFPAV
jgi:hypothetical protein